VRAMQRLGAAGVVVSDNEYRRSLIPMCVHHRGLGPSAPC
jgi:hypothetical protein